MFEKCVLTILELNWNQRLGMFEKCVLTILELNWNQRLGHKKTKLNICHYMLTSSTQLQNRSFHVVERTRTSSKCQMMKYARAKRAKLLLFIVTYANLWRSRCRRRRGCLINLSIDANSRCRQKDRNSSNLEISRRCLVNYVFKWVLHV